jgi:hypothetical protein
MRPLEAILTDASTLLTEASALHQKARAIRCAIGLLGRPVSECGRLRHGDGGHARGDRRRRVLMLPSLLD